MISATEINEINEIRIRIRELDEAEGHGLNVTTARTFWCERAVAWAKAQLTPNNEVSGGRSTSAGLTG